MSSVPVLGRMAPGVQLTDLHIHIMSILFVWRRLSIDRLHDELVACHYGLSGLSCTDLRIACYELQHIGLIGSESGDWMLSPATRQVLVEEYGEPTWDKSAIH